MPTTTAAPAPSRAAETCAGEREQPHTSRAHGGDEPGPEQADAQRSQHVTRPVPARDHGAEADGTRRSGGEQDHQPTRDPWRDDEDGQHQRAGQRGVAAGQRVRQAEAGRRTLQQLVLGQLGGHVGAGDENRCGDGVADAPLDQGHDDATEQHGAGDADGQVAEHGGDLLARPVTAVDAGQSGLVHPLPVARTHEQQIGPDRDHGTTQRGDRRRRRRRPGRGQPAAHRRRARSRSVTCSPWCGGRTGPA